MAARKKTTATTRRTPAKPTSGRIATTAPSRDEQREQFETKLISALNRIASGIETQNQLQARLINHTGIDLRPVRETVIDREEITTGTTTPTAEVEAALAPASVNVDEKVRPEEIAVTGTPAAATDSKSSDVVHF